jgi:streptogramin lyase
MNRTLFSALFGAVALVLAGCGASVDGGSGVFKNEADISVTSSFDKSSVTPGTNLAQSVKVTNNGPRDAMDFTVTLTNTGNDTDGGWPVGFFDPFELQAICTVTGTGEVGEPEFVQDDDYPNGAILLSVGLEHQSSADCEITVPVFYTGTFADSAARAASVTVCADEDSDNADPDMDNNCATSSADIGDAQEIVDFRDEIIYWAMTDRFFNGDASNDNLPGSRLGDEADPGDLVAWHGGDWAGLKQKIEEGYFQSLGFTAIWISPVVYQQPAFFGQAAYHGYWLDNFDDPEPHFGTWQELSDLVQSAEDSGLKIIIDLVVNHAGYDSMMVDLMPEWFRQDAPNCASGVNDLTCAVAGLPDVRQEIAEAREWVTSGASNVLIQSSASGFRIDTFKHVNRDYWYDFFAPSAVGDRSTVFSIGETFSENVDDIVRDLDSIGSPSVFDFPLYSGIRDAMAKATASMEKVASIFETDSKYTDPTRLTTFIDNHDVDRFMTEAISRGIPEGQATERLDMALGLLYGARGIPQVYYGTELAYQGSTSDASNRRSMTFPNGAMARLASLSKTQPRLSRKVTCGVTGAGDPTEVYGATFFARGGFNDWGNPPESLFQNMGNDSYQAEFSIAAGSYEFKVASEDWSTVDFTADRAIALGESVTLLPGSGLANTAITIDADGCYNFALDVTDPGAPVLTVTKVELSKTSCGVTGTGDPSEAYGVPFFARGGFNDWGNPPESLFQNMGNDSYQAEFSIAAGSYEFKVASEDWSTVDFTADGAIALGESVVLLPGSGLANTAITIDADGCYNFTLDVTDPGAPVLTVTEVRIAKPTCGVTGTGDPSEAYGVPFFARGGFNDWGNPPESLFQNMGNDSYQAEFSIAAGSYEFKVASEDWSTVDFTADGAIALGESVVLLPGSGLANTAITIDADGCYNFALDVTDAAAPVLTVTEVEIGGAPPSGREVDLFDRLASLAAARAAYPALARGSQSVIYSPAQGCAAQDTGNDPAEAFGQEMFVRGEFNGWSAPGGDAFVNQGGGIYEANVQFESGIQSYKVASGDFSIEFADAEKPTPLETERTLVPAPGPGTEGTVDAPSTGCYSFSMDANDVTAPTLVVSLLEIGDPTDVMAIRRDYENAASVVVVVNNEDEEVDLSTLGAGGIPVGFADGAVIEITGADTDLSVSGGLLIGTMPARSSYLVSDQ